MRIEQIADKTLQLSEEDRAKLVQKLLLRLNLLAESEIAEGWLIEAQRRAKKLDTETIQAITPEEVRCKAQALLR